MLISVLIISSITLGGLALTYLIAREKPLMWRLAAGNIVGSAVFGLIAFIAASLFGFGVATIAVSVVITMAPLALFRRVSHRSELKHNWAKAKGRFQGFGPSRLRGFLYYAFFFLLFWLFFDQAMYVRPDGIYTGGSNNLGDLPFHLGAIFGFTDGNNFPPQNPSWAGARFSYPFVADFLTACLVKLGAAVSDAMFVQNVAWAMSLLVILQSFATKLTGSKLAGRIAPFLLFFSGGLGFVWFAKDWWQSSQGVFDFLAHLPRDYTISDTFRWGNSMVVLFLTQRSLLLGMPLTILVLGWLWKAFATESTEEKFPFPPLPLSPFLLGLLAGTLPLIHLHSLFVLFVVTAFLFAMQPAKWKTWVTFGVGVAVIAIPELVWSMSGTANEAAKFFEFHFGWDKRGDNFIWFWIKNTGLLFAVLALGIYLTPRLERTDLEMARRRDAANLPVPASLCPGVSLLLFYAPFVFLFFVSNIAKLAPWEWDNIKILIYWFVASLPLMAYAIAWMWEKTAVFKTIAAVCFVILIFAGSLDVWRTVSGQIKSRVFDREAMQVAEQIKQKTDPRALFLNAPTYNSAIVLSGRQSLMRYTGHLASHGIDYGPREDDVKRIYEGGGVADILIRKYNIDYVLVSPEESRPMRANEEFFRKYPVIAEAGPYRVYKVK